MGKNYYFIEGTTDNDIIGFESYVDSLNVAIKNKSRFIGLISEFGTGKSSLIKMLKNSDNESNPINVITVNLWNCEENQNDKSKLDIHQVFLHQLIDELDIKTKEYYKKKINKKYRLIDIKLGYKNKFCIYVLFFYYLFSSLEILKFINLFPNEIYRNVYYSLISLLTILCILLYKPILSFNREKTDNYIDENDTKDLYVDIMKEYFSNKKNKNKQLVICLEELDRFSDYKVVIKHIKEFYKFYKLNPENVTFIIAIKSANSLAKLSKEDDKSIVTNSIKNAYEKVFDFILNMNSINIQDFDYILLDLLNEKKNDMPDGVSIPDINRLDAWRYLYYGKNITIRDLKHRYNYAISLYLSVRESGLEKVDFKKCLYISYLEDEYNTLYYKITSDSNVIMDVLLYYAKYKNLDNYEDNDFDDEEKRIMIDGIMKKYINVDYVYYFFKFPKNKKAYSIHELNLYNAIFFNETNINIDDSLKMLTDAEIKNIAKKRIDETILPDVVFKHKQLIKVEYESEKNIFMNTIELKYNLISNYSAFEALVKRIRIIDKIRYKHIFEEYLKSKKETINNLQPDEKSQLRLKLTKLFMSDSIYFDYMFDNNNEIISPEEIKNIADLKAINTLTNSKINHNYISSVKSIIKTEKYKTNILELLNKMSNNDNVTNDMYLDLFTAVDFTNYYLIDSDIKKIYNHSLIKMELNICGKLQFFINHIGKYNSFLDKELINSIDYSNPDLVKGYIDIIHKYNFISNEGLDLINNCTTKYPLSDDVLNALYSNGYYKTYVISRMLGKGVFEYEWDKKEKLNSYYIEYFTSKKEWNRRISNVMIDFLYDNVNYVELSPKQLLVFVNKEQNKDIISAVLEKEDVSFINDYIANISSINRNDRKEIFNLISTYHKNNKLNKKAKNNMKRLAEKNKNERNLFDDRRK